MAFIRCDSAGGSSGGGSGVTFTAKNSSTSGHNGYSSASTSASIVLPANGTYLISCVVTQSSAETYSGNSGWNTGSWTFSSTLDSNELLFNDGISRVSPGSPAYYGGTARTFTEQRIVKVGGSAVTATHNGSCSGYGGNILVEVSAIRLA